MTPLEIAEALAAPFGANDIKWKPQAVSGNRALAIAYISARAVMDRLDAIVGIDGWRDSYKVLADGTVRCRLGLKFGSVWITKEDVGGRSEQPDEGDKVKSAFSDALKRAAVKWGVGRFLYRLPAQWVGYDPQKRQFTETPKLPGAPPPNGRQSPPKEVQPPAGSQEKPPGRPVDVAADIDERLTRGGFCAKFAFMAHVREQSEGRWGGDLAQWPYESSPWIAGMAKPFACSCVSDLMQQKGESMNRVLEFLAIPAGGPSALRDLNWKQLAAAREALEQMPDRTKAGAK